MFSIKNNVPDVYVRKSRDFQMMCNTFNVLQMATKFDIDSMLYLTDTDHCNDMVLKLLQTKLGFFTNYEIMGEDLRTLLKSFPYLIRKKGTLTGIKQCIQLFFKIIDKTRATEVSVINNAITTTALNYNITNPVYVVNINISSKKFDVTLLTEMLRYIIPAGYGLKYYFYTPNEFKTAIFEKDTVNIVFVKSQENSMIRNVFDKSGEFNNASEMMNNINTSRIRKGETMDKNEEDLKFDFNVEYIIENEEENNE